MIYGELGRYPLDITIKTRMINYWCRIISGKQSKFSYFMYQKLRHLNSNTKWISKIKQILDEAGRSDIWLSEPANVNCASLISQTLKDQFLQEWSTRLDKSSKGLNYRIFKEHIVLEPYFYKLPTALYLNLAKLRTGNHRFPCERGRWLGIDISERKCILCDLQDIGDEYHYVLICPFFTDVRKKYIQTYYTTNPNILKYKQLLSDNSLPQLQRLAVFARILIHTVQ